MYKQFEWLSARIHPANSIRKLTIANTGDVKEKYLSALSNAAFLVIKLIGNVLWNKTRCSGVYRASLESRNLRSWLFTLIFILRGKCRFHSWNWTNRWCPRLIALDETIVYVKSFPRKLLQLFYACRVNNIIERTFFEYHISDATGVFSPRHLTITRVSRANHTLHILT